jgi:CubicO group peptidase (beta-lactamase class C family)
MKRLLVLVLFIATLSTTLRAASIAAPSAMVALAVTHGDQIVLIKGYGTAGGGRPMTPDTPMYIGSSSKSFTALAIMQLVEQGKIDLDAPVQTYLPWFRVADEAASAAITVRHLLTHTSGLSEFGYLESLPDDASIEAGVRDLQRAPDRTGRYHFSVLQPQLRHAWRGDPGGDRPAV